MGDSSDSKQEIQEPISRQTPEAQEGLAGITAANEFKRRSVRGGAVSVLGQGASIVLQIGTTLILARLLSPADYGLQAMVLTLVNFCGLFQDAGLSSATVQRQTLTDDQISTVFWINVGLGTFLTALVAAAGPLLASFYKDPRLLWLTVASASVFFFNSLAIQHRSMLNRLMRYTTNAKIGIASMVIGCAIAIAMAALGCGYWSLICQNISLPVVQAIGAWLTLRWVPGRPRWTAEIRSMLRYGGTVTLNGFVVYIAYNAEKVLLGRYWGAGPLGLYGRAYQLSNMPVQQATDSFTAVAFPTLSRLQGDPSRLVRAYLRAHSLVVSVTVPAVIACALFADEIVRILLGPKWGGAVPIVRLLSPTMLVFALMNPMSWLLRATGLVERSLKIAVFIAPVVILAVLAGLRYGPNGVAIGYSTAMVLLFIPLIAWAKHGTGVSNRDYWDAIKRPLFAGLIAGAAGWFAHYTLRNSLPPFPLFAVGISVLGALYLGILLFVMGQRAVYMDLLTHLFHKDSEVVAGS
ncbi:MAG: lipopolysaccharide biosynthesis protein [Candidatus Acidiferrales bacterium]